MTASELVRRIGLSRDLLVRSSQEVRPMPDEQNDLPAGGTGRRSGMTPAAIEDLKRKGMNQAEIARVFGVTPQAVSDMKLKYGRFSQTPRERVMEQFPWKVRTDLQACSPDQRMRDHAEYVATGGKGMSENKLKRLEAFYKRLERENVVVEYDPEIPPSPGIKCGGWRFVPREDSDGELMIRVNEHATVTDEGKVLWRIPKRRPQLD